MADLYSLQGDLKDLDPAVYEIIARETDRQRKTIVLIASESASSDAVHEAIASPFAHVYAEGYPRESSRRQTEEEILDIDYELARYRRNSDPRYYKGVEYADVLEALTRRRAAELFAANGVAADDIYVNVQPLSGGPANSCIYTALLNAGDTILGLKLSDGGHLSHGATVNRSGIAYKSVSYVVDPTIEALNYDAIEELAIKTKPKIIVAGFSAYPLIIDWKRFREIADKVGAYLHADIAHISGLVAAGAHPSPMGIADTIMTTTHKSLCGPRGAMIMTHRPDLSRKIDSAVFPGEQGGPHLNTMAALAVALKQANTEQFRELQFRIARNADRLAKRLQYHGLRVVFGGSENHLLLIDCKAIRVNGVPFTGDQAARILDVAGIVLNRNNIPGDRSAINPFGVRLGMVWASQLGFGDEETDKLGDAIAAIFNGVTPFFYRGAKGKEFRAKVDPAALAKSRALVDELTGYVYPELDSTKKTVTVRGRHSAEFLNYATTSNVSALSAGESQASHVYGHGVDASAVVEHMGDGMRVHFADAGSAAAAALWFADLSDAYVNFGDLHGRLPGPVVVDTVAAKAPAASGNGVAASKPFFVGIENVDAGDALPDFSYTAPAGDLKRTALYDTHVAAGAKMVDFGGYDMPVWYSGVSAEHAAVRKGAGLFDVSHMGVLDVSGAGSVEFLNTVTTADVARLGVNKSVYTYMLDPDGRIIDDLIIYRPDADRYMLVINASNNDEDWAWLNAVNDGSVCISRQRPGAKLQNSVTLRDLRADSSGDDRLVDIALQGPKSLKVLEAVCGSESAECIKALKWGGCTPFMLGEFNVIISRTGYTGERIAYEIFVHPDQLVALWDALVAAGATPCGLASRDSTRTEAGLPLHGHELAGPLGVNAAEAGFAKFVKAHKPFFIGRDAYIKASHTLKRTVVRFRMDDKAVRRPEMGDPIVDKRGKVVGTVTSCAIDSSGYLLGLALVPMSMRKRGSQLSIYQTGGGSRAIKGSDNVSTGAKLPVPNTATVISRFPKRK